MWAQFEDYSSRYCVMLENAQQSVDDRHFNFFKKSCNSSLPVVYVVAEQATTYFIFWEVKTMEKNIVLTEDQKTALEQAVSMEEMSALLKNFGYNVSPQELESYAMQVEDKELDMDELDSVAGGGTYNCRNCGKDVKNNAISRALHWLFHGCWGY